MTTRNKIVIVSIVALIVASGAIWYLVTKPSKVVDTPVVVNMPETTAEVTPPATIVPVGDSPIKMNEYPNRTNEELNSTIIKAAPQALVGQGGKANYIIVGVISPLKGWYIVTVRLTTAQTDDAKVIIKDNGTAAGGLLVIAGPGTEFPDSINLPPKVRIALS